MGVLVGVGVLVLVGRGGVLDGVGVGGNGTPIIPVLSWVIKEEGVYVAGRLDTVEEITVELDGLITICAARARVGRVFSDALHALDIKIARQT